MRKLFFCLMAVLALSLYDASAQNKGDLYVGGGLGVGTTSAIIEGESATSVEFSVAPEFGYFVADRFMVGVGAEYNIMASGGDAMHTFNVGPKLAYYVPICEKLYYTPSLMLAFCLAAEQGETMPGFALSASFVGLEYRPTERIGLSASLLSLDYALMSEKVLDTRLNIHAVNFGLSVAPTVGVKFYF